MGMMKHMIEDHIDSCRERLETEFLELNAVGFVKWLNEQDTMQPLWKCFEVFLEEHKAQEFWDYCMEDFDCGD